MQLKNAYQYVHWAAGMRRVFWRFSKLGSPPAASHAHR
jgi:hypothetical protein